MSKVINLRKKRYKSKPIVHKDRKNYNFNKLYGEKYKLLFLLISILGILKNFKVPSKVLAKCKFSKFHWESFLVKFSKY